MIVYVVTCEQYYANHFSVIGVFSDPEMANEIASKFSDYHVESFVMDEKPS